jgi:PAS domain S-box-containing protein
MNKPRILIIEDEAIVARDISAQLSELGYEPVGHASNADNAIALTQRLMPDLVLMDVHLSGSMDGISAAEVIRDRFSIPVVFLTAYTGGETLTRAKLAEPYGYITKPFDERELKTVLEIALYKHRMESKLRRSELKFRTLFDSTGDAVLLFDAGSMLDCNRAALAMFGCAGKEQFCATYHHMADLSPSTQPDGSDSLTLANRHIAVTMDKGSDRFDWVYTHPASGEDIHTDVLTTIIALDGRPVVQAVMRDISEKKRAHDALLAAKLDAERANRAKSQFLSGMSHELRTPMNAILGFGQLLQIDKENPLRGKQQEYVAELMRGGKHLLNLINELLDLTVIEAGKLRLNPVVVAVDAILDESIKLVHSLAGARDIRIGLRCADADGLHVIADRTRLKQALLNLLSNAIKYNRIGGSVVIACSASPERVRIDVTDSGPGISAENQRLLFKPFERLNLEDKVVQGAGIGLALSKKLVEAMQGEIGVVSKVGEGSTFWVSLPRADAVGSGKVSAPDVQPAVESPAATTHTFTVLHIEDDPVNSALVEAALKHQPAIRFVAVPSPGLGLDIAHADPPDLILLDIQLPGMDGYEVLRRLRAHPRTRDIPVIAVTAGAMLHDIDRGRDAGFTDYLTKPLDLARLLATVNGILGLTRAAG